MTLGECINDYLNEHNMSMRKFAQLAGVTHAYISNIVNNKTSRGKAPTPTLSVYRGIASAMGLEVNDLISMLDGGIEWGEQKTPTTISVGQTVLDLSSLDEDQVKLINDILKITPQQRSALLSVAESYLTEQ